MVMTTSQVEENSKSLIQKTILQTKSSFIKIEGLKIKILPGVFPTATDTRLLAKNIRVLKTHKVLDITTGCGVIAVIAGLQGAEVLASDINPIALRNAQENFKRFNLSVQTIESNIFTNIPLTKFDFIFTNPPYHEGEAKTLIEYAWFGGSKFIDQFFSQAKKYLKKDGKIIMVFPEWEKYILVEKIIRKYGFTFKIIDKLTSDDGERIYRLYEISYLQHRSL